MQRRNPICGAVVRHGCGIFQKEKIAPEIILTEKMRGVPSRYAPSFMFLDPSRLSPILCKPRTSRRISKTIFHMGLFCDYYKGMCYKRIFQLHRQLRGGINRQVVVLHRGKQQLLAARNLFLSLHLRLRTIDTSAQATRGILFLREDRRQRCHKP